MFFRYLFKVEKILVIELLTGLVSVYIQNDQYDEAVVTSGWANELGLRLYKEEPNLKNEVGQPVFSHSEIKEIQFLQERIFADIIFQLMKAYQALNELEKVKEIIQRLRS